MPSVSNPHAFDSIGLDQAGTKKKARRYRHINQEPDPTTSPSYGGTVPGVEIVMSFFYPLKLPKTAPSHFNAHQHAETPQ